MSHLLPASLSTPRLFLRRLQRAEAQALISYRSLPQGALYQSCESFGPEDASRLIDEQQDIEPGVPGTWCQLAIIERTTGSMIGDCGLHCHREDPRQMELGITLAPSHQRLGYAAEALKSVLRLNFDVWHKHRVSAVTAAENLAASSLFRRLGFRQEAHFIDHIWHKGRWESELVFALLEREWQSRSPAA